MPRVLFAIKKPLASLLMLALERYSIRAFYNFSKPFELRGKFFHQLQVKRKI